MSIKQPSEKTQEDIYLSQIKISSPQNKMSKIYPQEEET